MMPVKTDKPTEREMVEHRKTHLPYRSWCEECVAGKGRDDPQRRQELEDDAKPILELDYFFVKTSDVDDKLVTVLAGYIRKHQ